MNFISTRLLRQKLYVGFVQALNTHYIPTRISRSFLARSCRFSSRLIAKLRESTPQPLCFQKFFANPSESPIQKANLAPPQQKITDIHVEEKSNDIHESPELYTDHIQTPNLKPLLEQQRMRDIYAEWRKNNMPRDLETKNRAWDIYISLSDETQPDGKVYLNYCDISNMLHMIDDDGICDKFEKANRLKDDLIRLEFPIMRKNHKVFVMIYSTEGHFDLAEDHLTQYETAQGDRTPLHEAAMLNKILQEYVKSNNLDKILEYYDLIRERKVPIKKWIYGNLICRLIRFDHYAKAQETYKNMKDAAIKPSIRVYNELLKMALRLTDDELFVRYQSDIQASGLKQKVDNDYYSGLFRAYSNSRRPEHARRIYGDFLRSGAPLLERHIATYISGFLSQGDEGQAQRLFDSCIAKGDFIGPEAYLAFINHYSRNGRMDMIDYWLRMMERHGYPRTKLALSLIINNLSFVKYNSLTGATNYYKDMEACDLSINDSFTYPITHVDSMIRVNLMGFHARTKRMDRCMVDALKTVEECVNASYKTRGILISNIFDMIGYHGTFADLAKVRARIKEVGVVLNTNNLNSLAEALIRVGCPEEGVAVFWDEMFSAGNVDIKTLILFSSALKNDDKNVERNKIFIAVEKGFPKIAKAFKEWERTNK